MEFLAKETPQQMMADEGSGTSCGKPDWSCVSEKSVAVPRPGMGQVLLEMHGASVNPVNVDLVEPGCEWFGCSKGTVGNDGAGTVVAVGWHWPLMGAACSEFKIGDEVWGLIKGSYAQYAVADCKEIGKKPASLSFVDAGTIPVVGVTALSCLSEAGMPSQKSNLTVVVTSGQGGTGFMGVQLAKALGATRVITAASGPGIDFVKSLGADVVIDYHQQKLSDALSADSVDIVFDNFGAKGTADEMMHAIRSGGTFVVLPGGNRGKVSSHPKAGVKQITGFPKISTKSLDQLKEYFEAHKLQPRTMQPTYGLAEVAEAFTRLRSHGVLGKIAVVPSKKDRYTSTLTVV